MDSVYIMIRYILFNPPVSEGSREVANLAEEKSPHTPVYGVKEFVCLSVTKFDPNYSLTSHRCYTTLDAWHPYAGHNIQHAYSVDYTQSCFKISLCWGVSWDSMAFQSWAALIRIKVLKSQNYYHTLLYLLSEMPKSSYSYKNKIN